MSREEDKGGGRKKTDDTASKGRESNQWENRLSVQETELETQDR
jgi:hypothetical protein